MDKQMPKAQRRHMYRNMPSAHSHHFVGVLVFMETHRRILGGEFGKIPTPIRDDAFNMAGYCLDAPETLPAGSVAYERFGHEPDEWMVTPTTVEREPATHTPAKKGAEHHGD